MNKYITNEVGEILMEKKKWDDKPLYKNNVREETGYIKPEIPWASEVLKKSSQNTSPLSPLLQWHLSASPEQKEAAKIDLSKWKR
jgi:hypothetical protein